MAGVVTFINQNGNKLDFLKKIKNPITQEQPTLTNENNEVKEKIKDVPGPKVEKPKNSSDELSMCLIDPKSGSILYEKDSNKQMNMASTTKILTAIIGLENCEDLAKEVTVTKEEIQSVGSDYANMNLQEGEIISLDKIFEGFAVHSACEAGNVIAKETEKAIEQKTGKKVDFIELMNKKAEELGMKNSHFTNTYGETNENHYTSTEDMCKLMYYCVNQSSAKEEFRKYFGKTTDFVKPATNKSPQKTSYNSTTNNNLMRNEGYTLLGKTGWTSQAEQCWVFCAEDSEGNQIMGAVFSGANKASIANDVQELIRYGFKCLKKLSKAQNDGKKVELVKLTVPSSKNLYEYMPGSNTVYILNKSRKDVEEDRT